MLQNPQHHPFLWQASRPGQRTAPNYLLGTMRVPLSVEEVLGQRGIRILNDARVVLLEGMVQDDSEGAIHTICQEMAPGEKRSHKGRLWHHLLQAYKKQSAASLDREKLSLDFGVLQHAKSQGIPVCNVETPKYALSPVIENLAAAGATDVTYDMLKVQMPPELVMLYLFGASPPFLELGKIALSVPQLVPLLRRHQQWMPMIEKEFQKGGVFLAVGLAHLLCPGSVNQALRAIGYSVRRLPIRFRPSSAKKSAGVRHGERWPVE